jgi:Tfp pilus assembly protein PilE
MVVVILLGILAAIFIPVVSEHIQTSRTNACNTTVTHINRCLEIYRADTDSWPDTLKDFLDNTVYFADGPPECPMLKEYKWKTKKGEYRVEHHKRKDHERKLKK